MTRTKSICGMVFFLFLVIAWATSAGAQQPASALNGSWAVKYADDSEGVMTVEKGAFVMKIPQIGEIKGMVQERGTYFESIMSDRRGGIDFLFGYIKGSTVEGKLQEKKPCSELKKAFKSGVAELKNTCQAPFTALKR